MGSCLAAAMMVLASGSAASAQVCAGEIVAVGRQAADRATAERSATAAWDAKVQSAAGAGAPYRWDRSENRRKALTCKPLRSNILCEARTVACAPTAYAPCGRARPGENAAGRDFCATPSSSTRTAQGTSFSVGLRLATCDPGYALHTAPNASDRCVLDSRWR